MTLSKMNQLLQYSKIRQKLVWKRIHLQDLPLTCSLVYGTFYIVIWSFEVFCIVSS